MKPLILLLSFFLAAPAVKAQQVYYATKCTQGTWSDDSDRFLWGPAKDVNIRFTIQGSLILVGDQANSTYSTGDQDRNQVNDDGSHEYGWTATDEQNRNCYVKLIRYTGGAMQIYVIYNDVAYIYQFDAD